MQFYFNTLAVISTVVGLLLANTPISLWVSLLLIVAGIGFALQGMAYMKD